MALLQLRIRQQERNDDVRKILDATALYKWRHFWGVPAQASSIDEPGGPQSMASSTPVIFGPHPFVIWLFCAVVFVPGWFVLFSCVVRLAKIAALRLISDYLQLRL